MTSPDALARGGELGAAGFPAWQDLRRQSDFQPENDDVDRRLGQECSVSDVWRLIEKERLDLAEELESLAPQHWSVPSLCPDWTVADVAAHLAWQPGQSASEAFTAWVRNCGRVNKVNRDNARRWAAAGPERIVTHLRETAADRNHLPNQTPADELLELVCHGLDIRRPLGRPRPMPEQAYQVAADRLVLIGRALGIVFAQTPRRLARGLKLVTDDVDWSHGNGPEVRGSAEAVMLALAGRPVGRHEFDGEGAATLHGRLT